MTLIQAQERFIKRVNDCHPGHYNRVHKAAWKELHRYATRTGASNEIAQQICRDASDIAKLERLAD